MPVTTRNITFLVGNPNKPGFATSDWVGFRSNIFWCILTNIPKTTSHRSCRKTRESRPVASMNIMSRWTWSWFGAKKPSEVWQQTPMKNERIRETKEASFLGSGLVIFQGNICLQDCFKKRFSRKMIKSGWPSITVNHPFISFLSFKHKSVRWNLCHRLSDVKFVFHVFISDGYMVCWILVASKQNL